MTPDPSDMPEAETSAPRSRRLRTISLVAFWLILVTAAILWSQRKPIASDYIDRYLAERRVSGHYQIADIGFGQQRLTNVVLGPTNRPDLIADWIELRTHIGFAGVVVDEVRVGHLRLRATLKDGRLSLGAVDALLPTGSGKAFALPGIVADIADARVRLETPQGVIGVKIAGFGRLDNGFRGRVAVVADHLDLGGCKVAGTRAALLVQVLSGRPRLSGPARVAAVDCAGSKGRGFGADLSVTASAAFDHWDGSARLSLAQARLADGQIAALHGTVSAGGTASKLSGEIDLASGVAGARGWRAGGVKASGHYVSDGSGITFDGTIGAAHLVASDVALRRVTGATDSLQGTPVAPVAKRFSEALRAAGQSLNAEADVSLRYRPGAGQLVLPRLQLAARSGARLQIAGGRGAVLRWPQGDMQLDGTVQFGGGGLPAGQAILAQGAWNKPITGVITFKPYIAGDAEISAAPIRMVSGPGGTRLVSRVSLTGPIGDGRVEGLTLPVDARWNGAGALVVNPDCVPLSFRRLALAGAVLRPATVTLCPVAGALLRRDNDRLGGGANLANVYLSGVSGSSPLAIGASQVNVRFDHADFAATGVRVRVGNAARATRFDVENLRGAFGHGTPGGQFDGGAAQIANVPLLLSQMAGDWNLAGAVLTVKGALDVDDAAAAPRFYGLASSDVALVLRDRKITASGMLTSRTKGVEVARVSLAHDLSDSAGHADLMIAGINFSKALQPNDLTHLTYGVVEDVSGMIAGEGHVRWTSQGTSSDGVFRTKGIDLAAAFGPVTGVATEIHFVDLLNMESAPAQLATVKLVNPGVAVSDGTIRFQLLPNARVRIEDARWPFAGGSLQLEPTLLDFDVAQKRYMTFRITGMDAGQFLQQFDFKNLDATGSFDGTLPMVFDQSGGKIVDGRLKVRPGGGTIAYLGEITEHDVGFWGNMAFQALKSLKYRDLDVIMNGPLAGEIITEVHFAGLSQGAGAKRNFLFDRLQKLPFVFNVRIKAPFRQLIDTAQSLYDPRRLIERNLPALIEERNKSARPPAPPTKSVQPSDSRIMP